MSTVTSSTRHQTASMVVLDIAAAYVLLVHHRASGLWQFPGGHVDPDEAPDEAAAREVLEETGVSATITGQRPRNLPGMQWRPAPWIVAEIPAPEKPARAHRAFEPAHFHIDLLYIGVANSTHPLMAREDEVASARWVHLADVNRMEARGEVPQLSSAAYAELTARIGW